MIAVVNVSTGRTQWLDATKGGTWPAWTSRGLVFARNDGAIALAPRDGGARIIVKAGDQPALSPDAGRIAYVDSTGGSTQIKVAALDGSHAIDVSKLPGMDAARPSWTPGGRVLFTALARPAPAHSSVGFSLAEAANLLQAVMLSGVLLLLVRRWRAPAGAFTIVLALFALAMAAQSDPSPYYEIIPAAATGVLIDIALLLARDRARTGTGFHVLGFAFPAVFFALYLVATTVVGGGTGWTPDMLLGSPLLAGFAGLLVSFCYELPLPEARSATYAP
jgi:hypothetical protein